MIFWVLGCLAVFFGAVIAFSGYRSKQEPSDAPLGYKDDLPILPRHKRFTTDIDKSLQDKVSIDPLNDTPDIQGDTDTAPLQAVVRQAPNTQTQTDTQQTQTNNTKTDNGTDALSNLAAAASLQTKKSTPSPSPQDAPQSETNNANITQQQAFNQNDKDQDSEQNQTPNADISTNPNPKASASVHINPNTNNQSHANANTGFSDKPTTQNSDIATQDGFCNTADAEFTHDTPAIDRHLEHQETLTDSVKILQNNDALINHKKTLTIHISPKDSFDSFSGKKILGFAKTYAMKYGIMDMFHRYKNPNGTGNLWFSMLGVTHEGVVPFDLNAVPSETYRGIALFVALPNPEALSGFDSMVEVAKAIAESIDGHLHDDNGYLIDAKELVVLRTVAEQNLA